MLPYEGMELTSNKFRKCVFLFIANGQYNLLNLMFICKSIIKKGFDAYVANHFMSINIVTS